MQRWFFVVLCLLCLTARADVIQDIPNAADTSITTAFNAVELGQMLLRFYLGLRDNTVIFNHLTQLADALLLPLLTPMLIICAGARLTQEIYNPSSDAHAVLNVLYITGAVVLLLSLYRIVLYEVTIVTNALVAAAMPADYGFEGVMRRVEGVMEEFLAQERSANIVGRLLDNTLALYTQYVLAWTSKWGVMVMHGLLSYARKLLYVINYVLGMFLLPLLILSKNNLPRNWFIITLFIFLWGIMEAVLVAAVGELGISALRAALQTDATLPAFSRSLFFIMITTVNILIGLALLGSIWIVKSYFLSPGSIAAMTTALALPAAAMARMTATAALSGGRLAYASARSGGLVQARLPRLPGRQGEGGGRQGLPKTPKLPSPEGAKPASSRPRKLPKLRTIIEHEGALNRQALPSNVLNTARVGRRRKLR